MILRSHKLVVSAPQEEKIEMLELTTDEQSFEGYAKPVEGCPFNMRTQRASVWARSKSHRTGKNPKDSVQSIDVKNLKRMLATNGFGVPPEYVYESQGEMMVKNCVVENGALKDAGLPWQEGRVFRFRRKVGDAVILNDTCTVVVEGDRVQMFHLVRHSVRSVSGQQITIKMPSFSFDGWDVARESVSATLAYIVRNNVLVPVWAVQHENTIFLYNAQTGEAL